MKFKNIIQYLVPVILLMALTQFVIAQEKNLYHSPPSYGIKGKDLVITASLINTSSPMEAILYYRSPRSESYLEVSFINKGFNWEATIPKFAVTDSGVEYVIAFRFSENLIISYPRVDPFNNPYTLQVVDDPSARSSNIALDQVDILILSPDIGEIIEPSEVFIAASFFYVKNIDMTSVILTLDGVDQTSEMILEDDILTFDPGLVNSGDHNIQIIMKNKDGDDLAPFKWSFTVGERRKEMQDYVSYKGSVQNRLSSEKVSGISLNVAEVQGKFDIDFNWAEVKADARLTSRESPYIQPQNRLGAQFSFSSFIDISVGDFYPRLSQFMIDGKRVRGIGFKSDFNWIKFDFVQGELNRVVHQQKFLNGGYRLNNNLTKKNSDGSYSYFLDRSGHTFKRNIIAAKLSTEFFSRYKFGVHLMSARDDTNSVKRTLNNTLFSSDSLVIGVPVNNYDLDGFTTAIESAGHQLNIVSSDWSGRKPQDNLLLGFNIGTSFDDQKINFDFDWNISLYNRNIWGGALSKTNLDTTLDDSLDGFIGLQYNQDGTPIDGNISTIKTSYIPFDPIALKDIFIINTNMTPLVPFDINSNLFSRLINMPSSAFKFSLKGNYKYNKLLVEYRQIGPEYVSLGNPFLRNNSRQFIISDRINLLDNKLFVNIGFKHLDNKILKTTINPLNTNTLFLNLNFLVGPGLPSFAINYQSIGKNNEKSKLDSVGGSIIDLRENSNTSNNMIAMTVPYTSNGIKHNFTLNLANMTNLDNLASKRSGDYLFPKTDSRTISLNLTSEFSTQLNTNAQFSQTKLEIPTYSNGLLQKIPFTWTNLSVSANYKLIDNKTLFRGMISVMDNKSQIRSQLLGFRAGLDYNLREDISASLMSFLRLNYISSNNGIQSYKEGVEVNSSGLIFNLNYNF